MDRFEKLSLLQDDSGLEADDSPAALTPEPIQASTLAGTPACPGTAQPVANPHGLPIHMAAISGGRRVPILKSLLTSACERNCFYCPFRAGRDSRRVNFRPEEMARTVVDLTQARVIEGAFISSGILAGGVKTQDKLLATAEILRNKLHYSGYLHLKIMPGAEQAQIERAMQLADRVSINLEGANAKRLELLAPQKDMLEELLRPLRIVEQIRRSQPAYRGWKGRWPSSTTQFVVGAVGENDLELLTTVEYLYSRLKLARTYFSGFAPVRDTPFEERERINPWRTYRLYQASFLLRDYGFGLEDMPFMGAGDLPLETDPKQAWARFNLEEAPVEVNRAERQDLLRIPGIGPRSAEAILRARVRGMRLRSLEDMKALGISTKRAAPFILLDGRRPASQLRLF